MSEDLSSRLKRMKANRAKLRNTIERTRGRLAATMERLKDEFDCESLEEAQEKMDALDKEHKGLSVELTEACDDFDEAWEAAIEQYPELGE